MDFNEQNFTAQLTRVFKLNGLGAYLNSEKSEKFYRLTVRMLEENEKYNLTAITDPEKIILNHYADCATLAQYLPKGAKIADIGCGAGFPTLPLAIVRDDVQILAIDSTAKRVNYVEQSARLLGLTNVTCAVMRAEDGGKSPELRESFDFATARAVAEMRVLCELCLPFVKVGGELIAMKGKNAQFELSGAKRAISLLGGKDVRVREITLSDGSAEPLSHPLISIKKGAKTPMQYPRAFSQISKKPL